MLTIKFHESADLEAVEAIAFYEGLENGLGVQFRLEIEEGITRILSSPMQFPVVYRSEIRRLGLDRFPYSIFFTIEQSYVVVLAVFHWRRDPAIWQGRVD